MFFGFESERVDVDTGAWNVGVVLVRLDKIEVSAHAFRESVVTIELEFGTEDRVEASVTVLERKVVTSDITSAAWEGTTSWGVGGDSRGVAS